MMQSITPSTFEEFSLATARDAVDEFRNQPGALISALHKLQKTFGYVDEAAMPMLATLFNLSRAEVHGVTSFYHDFRRTPPGRYTVRVCQAEACQAMGSEALTTSIKEVLGCEFHETSKDGCFSLEPVYCLGNCACSPNIMVDKQVYARVTPESFRELSATLASKKAEVK